MDPIAKYNTAIHEMHKEKKAEKTRKRHERLDNDSIRMVIMGEQKKRTLSRMKRMRKEQEDYR